MNTVIFDFLLGFAIGFVLSFAALAVGSFSHYWKGLL